jgi:thiamine biosynthesis lipoprotein
MGTFVALEVDAPDEHVAIRAVHAGFAAVRRVDLHMHPSRAGSDLARIHSAAIGEPVPIDTWTWQVLALARHLGTLSGGLFDPCLPGAPGRIEDLELIDPAVAIRHADLHLDLGGIAKGFAVDSAIEAMQHAGAVGGIANAGGDLRAFGVPSDVLLRFGHGAARAITLDNAALAVSDPDGPSHPPEHAGYYLRTGVPRGMRPAAVIASSAALADALATCAIFDRAELDRDLFGPLGAIVIR